MLNIQTPQSPYSFSANTYVIFSGEECAVIDPAVPYDRVKFPMKVKYVFLTHVHFDHMLELDSWASADGAEVIVSEKEFEALSDSYLNCYKLFSGQDKGYYGKASVMREGDTFIVGDSTIKVMECPGHTCGSVALLSDSVAFVGDTVFAGGGYGRWDLPSGDYRLLKESIQRILTLPDSTVLYPGHGDPCTVEQFKTDYSMKRII